MFNISRSSATRVSGRLWRRLAVSLVMAAAFGAAGSASAQTTSPALSGSVPRQLTDGSAKLLGHYEPTSHLRLVLGLEHPNLAGEEAFLKDLQDRNSPNYHKFLTAAEWNARFSPSAADEQAVVDWANSQGLTVSQRYPNRLLVDIDAPAGTIEKALGVTINSYSLNGRTTFSNDRAPTLPAAVQAVIHSVGGLNSMQVLHPANKGMKEPNFPDYSAGPGASLAAGGHANATAKRPVSRAGAIANVTGGAYDPSDVYSSQMFNVDPLNGLGHCCNPLNNAGSSPPNSSIAIATAGTQQSSDMIGFQAQYPYLAYNWVSYYIDGTPACCDGEGTMDLEWSTAWANSFGSYQNTAKVYMYDGVNANFSTFTDVYNKILTDGFARVFSTSWGCEEIYCASTSVMDTDHGIFNSMAGQGWTMLAATGDQGAAAGCGARDAVQHPGSDPNIIGAGGTETYVSSGVFISETGWTGNPYGCSSNGGGSTGGTSAYYAAPTFQTNIGISGNRQVPDLALNSDWYNTPQNLYFEGSLSGNGGTSIVAPSLAGFFAQANAYLDFISTTQSNGKCTGGRNCAPLGNANYELYYFGSHSSYAAHYPFYDVTSGCNNNDITAAYGLNYFCAVSGYDQVTGWGTINALQLAWALNTYQVGDFGAPTTAFASSATPSVWYNTDQYISWAVSDTTGSANSPTGVSGFTYAWDYAPPDSSSVSRPGNSDGYFTGPTYLTPNGLVYVSAIGQGCHTVYVRGYDNSGFNQLQSFGPVCYDTVAPTESLNLSGTVVSGTQYKSAVTVTIKAKDTGSGVASTQYNLDSGAYTTYTGAFVVSGKGNHKIHYYTTDVAGNVSATNAVTFSITPASTTAVTSSANPAKQGSSVTFTATVTQGFGGAPKGSAGFYDGSALLGTSTLNTSGVATFTTSSLAVGGHSITATYTPTSSDLGSTSPVLTETITGAGSFTVTPASLTFPATLVGTTSAALNVTVKNGTSSAVSITSVSNVGGSTTGFPLTNGCGATLSAGASCTISVKFKPGGAGARSTTLTIVDGAGTQKVALSGTGTTAGVTLTPSSLTFPAQTVGTQSSPQTITMKNAGTASIGISSISNVGGTPTSFKLSTTCGTTLAAGASCTISESFKPGGTGTRSSTLTVVDDDGTQTAPLSGTGD